MLLKNTKKAFTLIELLVVISIISILATLWVLNMSTAWADDTARLKSLNDIRVNLEDFKQKKWVYPNSSSTWRKYPASGCSVSWYDLLASCFVSQWGLVEDSETYDNMVFDPMEWEFNDFDQEYAFYYGTANNGNKYKICALAWKQDNEKYKGLDWNDAQEWSRYICVTSSNTKLTDVSTLNK